MLPYPPYPQRSSSFPVPLLPAGEDPVPRRNLLKSCSMSSFRSEPILWIHVAGLAVVPIFLELCLGLAVSDPAAGMVGAIIVAAVGVVPVLWMQLSRLSTSSPF